MRVAGLDSRTAADVPPSASGRPARAYRALFSIAPESASFAIRGFPTSAPARARLERIGATFIRAYNAALVADDITALCRIVDREEPTRRGFAVEGAAMGAAIADAAMLGGTRLDGFLQACADPHTYLAHVGIGWALARVPWRRRALLRERDPVHHWLVYDGLGFHDAYFFAARIRAGRHRRLAGYASRVYDQGIGRAVWFMAGGDVAAAVAILSGFAPPRQPDLWAGLGLAVAYAGGADAASLARIAAAAAAGDARADLAQGVAFAAEAHARAGVMPAHTRAAAAAIAGKNADDAVAVVRAAREALPGGSAEVPAYEIWRRSVRAAFADP